MALSKAITGVCNQSTFSPEAQMCENCLTIPLRFEHLGDDFAGLQSLCLSYDYCPHRPPQTLPPPSLTDHHLHRSHMTIPPCLHADRGIGRNPIAVDGDDLAPVFGTLGIGQPRNGIGTAHVALEVEPIFFW